MESYYFTTQGWGTTAPMHNDSLFGNGNLGFLQPQVYLPTPPPDTTLQFASEGQAIVCPMSAPKKKLGSPRKNPLKLEGPRRNPDRPKGSVDIEKRAAKGSGPPKRTSERQQYDRKCRQARKARKEGLVQDLESSLSQEVVEPVSQLLEKQAGQINPPALSEIWTQAGPQELSWSASPQNIAPPEQEEHRWEGFFGFPPSPLPANLSLFPSSDDMDEDLFLDSS